MIFVSFGAHYQPFDRLAKAIDDYSWTTNEKIVVQLGVTKFDFKSLNVESFDSCVRDVMVKYLEEAEIVILQGGWGSISEAIEMGKKIIVVPRIEGLEHIHNQEQLVRKLESLGCVIGLYDNEELSPKIELSHAYDFKPLKRGNAEQILKTKINDWFCF